MKRPDLCGQRFGRLVALHRVMLGIDVAYSCRCDCGAEKVVRAGALYDGDTKSCGCLRRAVTAKRMTTHGLYKKKEFRVWCGIINRCYCVTTTNYAYYGGRGIKVCSRWKASFENFYNDMGPRPTTTHSIERINNNGNYTPKNCRWASKKEQQRNKRGTLYVTHEGERLPLVEVYEKLRAIAVVNCDVFRSRLRKGWSIAQAISIPLVPREMRRPHNRNAYAK